MIFVNDMSETSISLALANEGDRVLQGESESGGDLGVRHQFRLQATRVPAIILFREQRLTRGHSHIAGPRATRSSRLR
jgi:hypothetical protein